MGASVTDVIQEITQSLLALLVVGGCIALALVLILRGQPATDVPDWLTLALGAVAGFYFGARGASSTIATLTNGPMHLVASLSQRAPQRATDPAPTAPTEGTTA